MAVDFYLLLDAIIGISLLFLSVISLMGGGYQKIINKKFAVFSLLIAIWIITNHLSNDSSLPYMIILISNCVVFSSSFGVLILLIQFISSLANDKIIEKIVHSSCPILWIICLLGGSNLVVSGIEQQGNVYAIQFGPAIWLYGLGILFMVCIAIVGLFRGMRHSNEINRQQLVTIGLGLLISLPLIMLFSFIIPVLTGDFSMTEFGITPLIILVISLYYGVVRYQLFDIRLAVVRTITYTLSLLTLSAIYYFLAYALSIMIFSDNATSSMSLSPVNILLALFLAFLFQPIKNFFDKITNKIFFKDNYDTNEFYARLNQTLTSTTDLRGLLEKVAYEIADTLKSEQAFFFIHTSKDHYITAGTSGYTKVPRADALELQIVHEMDYGLFIASLRDENDPVRRLMVSHGVELILPLKQASILGYLCLGNHKTSNYSRRDIEVLNTIADELVIAIQNALAVQEIREFNVTLQQRINNATRELRTSNIMLKKLDKIKDEFVSIASHQLRTPLTSVKGYISMILDGDAGSITETQRELLDEAYISSERMVHLINDFLNVSRLQTGKFIIDKKPADLSKIIGEEIDSLRISANSRNREFIYNPPKDFPILNIDEGKIRQVIMNFADNAIYYSNENSKIKVNLLVEDKEVIFTVKDSGIGVPKSEQVQLFTKFYRASNAKNKRPDGTGVGLFLAKKVIDSHHGKIVFESIENKGSTFGFRLPIDND